MLALLSSCEQTVELGEVPYLEKIVVDGMITTGEPIRVTFSKTLQPTTNIETWGGYDTASVRLSNVIATVTVGDVVCNLKHIRFGTYIALKPNGDTLFCEAKKTYTLQATWNGHTISAQTTAPESTLITIKPAQIDSTASRPQENYVNLRITLPIQFDLQYNQIQTNTLYIKTQETKESQYIIQETDSLYNAWEFYSYFPIYRITNKPTETKDGMFNVMIEGYFGKHSATVFQYYTQAYVETIIYDKQFLDYINTEWNNNGDGDFFGSSGNNVHWNVKGDGLGLFLSRTVTKKPVSFF